jgi:hypothetical protein
MPQVATLTTPTHSTIALNGVWSNTGVSAPLPISGKPHSISYLRAVTPTQPWSAQQNLNRQPMMAPRPVVFAFPQNQQLFLLNMSGVARMASTPVERPFPDHLYVPIHEVVMRVSIAVLLLCTLSLLTSLLTNFNLIHPLFALLFAVAAVSFYLMGRMFEIFRKT